MFQQHLHRGSGENGWEVNDDLSDIKSQDLLRQGTGAWEKGLWVRQKQEIFSTRVNVVHVFFENKIADSEDLLCC